VFTSDFGGRVMLTFGSRKAQEIIQSMNSLRSSLLKLFTRSSKTSAPSFSTFFQSRGGMFPVAM